MTENGTAPVVAVVAVVARKNARAPRGIWCKLCTDGAYHILDANFRPLSPDLFGSDHSAACARAYSVGLKLGPTGYGSVVYAPSAQLAADSAAAAKIAADIASAELAAKKLAAKVAR